VNEEKKRSSHASGMEAMSMVGFMQERKRRSNPANGFSGREPRTSNASHSNASSSRSREHDGSMDVRKITYEQFTRAFRHITYSLEHSSDAYYITLHLPSTRNPNPTGMGSYEDEQEKNMKFMWDLFVEHEKKYNKNDKAENQNNGHNGRDQEKGASGPREISTLGIEDALYELFFTRKELISSIYTDYEVLTHLARIVGTLIYPAAFIAVSRIWGYQNAFGFGVDLFKVYMLAASYLINSFRRELSFLISMIVPDRPLNMGDILLIGDQTYKVRHFNITHVILDGPHRTDLPVSYFLENQTINLSKQGITDSVQIFVPLTTPKSLVHRSKVFSIMYAYQDINERDIQRSSIRCGWIDTANGSKILQCNWRYNFRIYDRGRLNWARVDMRQWIVEHLEDDLEEGSMRGLIAGGGGYNYMAQQGE
jgi:hypothetical protein